jgi:hypothetical protein
VDTGCIVAFDESVTYDIQFVGGIKTAIFGGEGLFLATLTGPGHVVIQSMTLEKLRRELIPLRQGGGERGPLGSLGGVFGSERLKGWVVWAELPYDRPSFYLLFSVYSPRMRSWH